MLLPDVFDEFILHSIFSKMVFCLGEKQGMIVNNECSSWYNRVGDFDERSACKVSQSDPTLECEAIGNNCYGS